LADRLTLSREVSWRGIGIHSGQECAVTVRPRDGGIAVRMGGDLISLSPGLTCETLRRTGLEHRGRRVQMVEHLLSALNGLGITDAEVHPDGQELPILDGSAGPYAQALWAAGLQVLPPLPTAPPSPVEVRSGQSHIRVEPGSGELDVAVEFAHPAIGSQRLALRLTPEVLLREIAPARTFGFLDEAEKLRAAGLALGASLDNTVVFSEDGPMTPLRFPDEPVRHKMLDLIGDLALSGLSIYDLSVVAVKPGHAANVEAARRLFEGG
jgi:UDP-3-O-[3-hydroxymyristoyl] N-acetylglucosamine deacetylase